MFGVGVVVVDAGLEGADVVQRQHQEEKDLGWEQDAGCHMDCGQPEAAIVAEDRLMVQVVADEGLTDRGVFESIGESHACGDEGGWQEAEDGPTGRKLIGGQLVYVYVVDGIDRQAGKGIETVGEGKQPLQAQEVAIITQVHGSGSDHEPE